MQTTFAQRLRKAREIKGLSQAELARRLGLKAQAIQYLESDENNALGSRHTARLAQELGVDAVWLGSGSGPMQPSGAPAPVAVVTSPADLLKAIRELRPELRDALGLIVRELAAARRPAATPRTFSLGAAEARAEQPQARQRTRRVRSA
jgi:transcriptional regulator with XRE-family HTH domain